MEKTYKLHMGPAQCAVDLGDGSERGEYVNQDYILNKLGRPHRAINLMYCYYPKDAGWPGRASVVHANPNVSFAWDYPYDDYFTYKGGLNGTRDDEPFTCMREVRRHGQDVLLTLTMDPFLEDEYIRAVAEDLRTFGRLQLRVNHEATGNWFSFNRRASYEEVAAFFVRVCKIFHETAPNVKLILCLDGYKNLEEEKMAMEDIFKDAIAAADIESVDRYLALHWGWPFDVAEEGGNSFARYNVDEIYQCCKRSYHRYNELNGDVRPMVLSELNADGDVTGAYDQADMMKHFCELLKADTEKWLSGFTFYQFRDRGRLGLEIQDPNNAEVGIEQPVMDTYREIIHDDFFLPKMTVSEEAVLPATLRWGGSEDAEGLAMQLHFDADPVFCEAYFEDDLVDANLMMEINGHWFYKAPGVKCIDFMSAFYKKHLTDETDMTLKIFAPPASGENEQTGAADWDVNYYCTLKSLPKVRIRTAPVAR